MEHGQMLASTQIDSGCSENNALLPASLSSTLHRRSVDRVGSESNAGKPIPPMFSMEEMTARRRGKRVEDAKLPKQVRNFYKKQDDLISTFERVYRLHSTKDSDNEEEDDEETSETKTKTTKVDPKKRKKRISLYTKLSLLVNICLLGIKIVAAIISHSLSVISSVVDSGVDLTSSIILFWATRAIKRRDPILYPQGRTRLEPISIVILSVIMCSASIQVISESLQTTIEDIQMMKKYPSNSSEYVHPVNMTAYPIAIMCTTIVLKLMLFFLCSRESSATLNALSQDHRNDVFSNTVALICGIISFHARKNHKFLPIWLVLADSIGAILISIYILITWIRQANQQVKRLSGHTAKPEFLQQITWITFHHSPLILKIDTVRAFHFGTHFLVEVDIVLPENMSLREAHDIGEQLQKKIERIPEVERAFVHLDYEFNHKASDEHKVV
ncbi:unnamed protein product [Adineta steineri]|uniref:Cation efflux protein cytoplasmic domain-containing protein n=1 Tax=Adineta steineri TaxID=433720 RepID=A0A814BU75_9BILA|nr:unnamed protein product [Adineta steineri]CAF1089441.1 unnamed protein product [Adineta steineri]CAF1099341.1 unnamed protein product [Adineta steineri]